MQITPDMGGILTHRMRMYYQLDTQQVLLLESYYWQEPSSQDVILLEVSSVAASKVF